MIICPFCRETIDEDDLVYEFNYGHICSFLYHKGHLDTEPRNELFERPVYVKMSYGWGGPKLGDAGFVINSARHPQASDGMSIDNHWSKVRSYLSGRGIFDVESDDKIDSLPVAAHILPMMKGGKKDPRLTAEGTSTGVFCPICEQHLKPEVIKTEKEVHILLSGRPGSGKTVYVTQAISELMNGREAQNFTIEPANQAVNDHFYANRNRIKAFNTQFVRATDPNTTQDPYVFLVRSEKDTVRLVIQDIAGEDVENRIKYSNIVRSADMILLFVDPWHIDEIRSYHRALGDQTNAVVDRSVNGQNGDLNGVFQQMLSIVNREFTEKNKQLVGVMLVKGDYLNPPMLAQGNQPECEMMRQPVQYGNLADMEMDLGMRSSFIRQCIHEWESTRGFARDVESRYSAHNTRYFVSSALGQSTHLRKVENNDSVETGDDPDDQFAIGDSSRGAENVAAALESWNYDEQVLEAAARPDHVVDPILWCFARKGVKI